MTFIYFFSPLHMSVLMRKPELVKRYCCTLHILEASLDLINDEKHVRLIFETFKSTTSKGQLISKCPFGVIDWTKIPTKHLTNFCPRI